MTSKPHQVSVYRRGNEVARGDCDCGWTTGLQDSIAWVAREAAAHERRTTRTTVIADRFNLKSGAQS